MFLWDKGKKIHAGIIFKQGPIMKSYVDFNSEKRAQATNKFDTDFYKLLSNSLYGKTIENPEKRSKVKLCSDLLRMKITLANQILKMLKESTVS